MTCRVDHVGAGHTHRALGASERDTPGAPGSGRLLCGPDADGGQPIRGYVPRGRLRVWEPDVPGVGGLPKGSGRESTEEPTAPLGREGQLSGEMQCVDCRIFSRIFPRVLISSMFHLQPSPIVIAQAFQIFESYITSVLPDLTIMSSSPKKTARSAGKDKFSKLAASWTAGLMSDEDPQTPERPKKAGRIKGKVEFMSPTGKKPLAMKAKPAMKGRPKKAAKPSSKRVMKATAAKPTKGKKLGKGLGLKPGRKPTTGGRNDTSASSYSGPLVHHPTMSRPAPPAPCRSSRLVSAPAGLAHAAIARPPPPARPRRPAPPSPSDRLPADRNRPARHHDPHPIRWPSSRPSGHRPTVLSTTRPSGPRPTGPPPDTSVRLPPIRPPSAHRTPRRQLPVWLPPARPWAPP